MKTALSRVLGFVLLGVVLPNTVQSQSAQPASAPNLTDDYFIREVKPLNVMPVTDTTNSYSDTICPDGGQLVTLDAAGNTYTLTVPKGALGFPERLTMTPLKALNGMPFKGGVNAGVQLEPEGTFFVQPVRLEVEFASKPDLNTLTPFDYTGAGQDFTTTMLMHDPGHYVFLLNHFSGAGFAISTAAEEAAEAVRQPLADEERINQALRQAVMAAHEDQVKAEEFGQQLDKATQDALYAASTKWLTEYQKEVVEPLGKTATQNCTAATLYVHKLLGLERQRQMLESTAQLESEALTAAASMVAGPTAERCLAEEAQSCYKTGDLTRFTSWYLSRERIAQMSGSSLSASVNAKFDKAYNACAQFEVQFNATLAQKRDTDTTADTGGVIAARGKGSYNAAITSILPVKSSMSGGVQGIFAGSGFPHGEQPLPYARYAMSFTVNGGVAVAQTSNGAVGVASNCAESGTGTTPGQLTVYLLPIFTPVALDPNVPDPALQGLTPLQKRILQHTPRVGLLAPPRRLDVQHTLLDIAVGQPTERTQSGCDGQSHDLTTWLDAWKEQLKKIGDAVVVTLDRFSPFSGTNTSEGLPGFELKTWQKTAAFPLKIVQDTSKDERASSSMFTEQWHLDITVVHTPKETR